MGPQEPETFSPEKALDYVMAGHQQHFRNEQDRRRLQPMSALKDERVDACLCVSAHLACSPQSNSWLIEWDHAQFCRMRVCWFRV